MKMNMNTAAEIQAAIIQASITNDELNAIVETIRFKRTQIAKDAKRSITIGTTVSFTNSKTGTNVQGTVEKIMTKNVLVNTSIGRWKVPANMLVIS